MEVGIELADRRKASGQLMPTDYSIWIEGQRHGVPEYHI